MDGPDGDPANHDTFGDWSPSEENGDFRPRAPRDSARPSPVRFCPGPGSGAAPQTAPASPPASGWDSCIGEVMKRVEVGSLSDPLEVWSQDEQYWPTAVGRRVIADPPFLIGLGSTPMARTRSISDIMTRALTLAGADIMARTRSISDIVLRWRSFKS